VLGSAGLLIYDFVIGFTPLILGAIGCRFFKPGSSRPVLASLPENVEQFGRSPAAADNQPTRESESKAHEPFMMAEQRRPIGSANLLQNKQFLYRVPR